MPPGQPGQPVSILQGPAISRSLSGIFSRSSDASLSGQCLTLKPPLTEARMGVGRGAGFGYAGGEERGDGGVGGPAGGAGRGGAVSGGFDLCGERLFYSFSSSVSFITHGAGRYPAA